MIALFGGEKGGTGKTTLATNFAVWLARKGDDVLLLDADPQKSASKWVAVRSRDDDLPKVHYVQRTGGDVHITVRDLAGRYGHVIIDAGGRDSKELRSAMTVAERMYVSTKPSQFDLWTLQELDELVSFVAPFNPDLMSRVIFTMASTHHHNREVEDALKLLSQSRLKHLKPIKPVVHSRKVYRDAIVVGRGVIEMSDRKATEEVNNLCEELFGVD